MEMHSPNTVVIKASARPAVTPMGFSIRWVMWLKAPIIRVTVPRSPSTSANVTMMFK